MKKISEIYGIKTFNHKAMLKHLPKEVCEKLLKTIDEGEPLDKEIARSVAHGLKEWALSNGANHFTHWFHPLRGTTAEKHNTFISKISSFEVIERFSEKELIQGEPDASSFPSGGIRSTFEARGYTAWDPTSPAFIIDDTLCIPSIFISYNGEILDKKTPLLKSLELVEKQSYKILKLFGNRTAKYVKVTVGAEQEYFLIDKKYFEKRPDLMFTGRTLIGAASPKDQQLEDHYFGSIKERVLDFMKAFEEEFIKLGIPVKTRHNEVAPNQFEFAPIFENANIAADHNLLAMEIMRKIANKKGFAILFHEKPFKGINGSGKHVNWSLMDSDGKNLLKSRRSEKQRLQFLFFLSGIILGIKKYEKILKLFTFSYSNELRLGGNEAPPSIISVFIGDSLYNLINKIATTEDLSELPQKFLSVGLSKIPSIKIDYTDRNRTSPFAFTGNKFEYRMPGSSFAISTIITALNTIIYYGLKEIHSYLEAELNVETDFDIAVLKSIKKAFLKSKDIIYNGDCYSEEWKEEAKKRGLSITSKYFELLNEIDEKEFEQLFIKTKILSKRYIDAYFEIEKDIYFKNLLIEASTLIDMVKTGVLHASIKQLKEFKEIEKFVDSSKIIEFTSNLTKKYAKSIIDLQTKVKKLDEMVVKFKSLSTKEKEKLSITIKEKMEQIREICDFIEQNTDEKMWPFPRYKDMLFKI